MKKIALIYGSSRPSKVGERVAEWFSEGVKLPDEYEFEMVDLKELNLPMFDEQQSPMMDNYQKEHSKSWSKQIDSYEGVVFVAAEYNLGPTPILKNAIDFLYKEWQEKPVAFISYGSYPKSTAVEMLRTIMGGAFKSKIAENTVHVYPAYKLVSDDGVDAPEINPNTLQQVADELVSLTE